jgi:hypothetical protein
MSEKCQEHSESIKIILDTQKDHTKVLTELVESVKEIKDDLRGTFIKKGVYTLIREHATYFKWLGGMMTALIIYQLKDLL